MGTNIYLRLPPEYGAARPILHPRRKPSRMTAPPGACPFCDARREYNREQVKRYRPQKRKAGE